jgi:hypothetical protein
MNLGWFYVVVIELCVASYVAILMFLLMCLDTLYFRLRSAMYLHICSEISVNPIHI